MYPDRNAFTHMDTNRDPVSEREPDPFPDGGPFFFTVYDRDGQPLARGDATVVRHSGPIAAALSFALRFVNDGTFQPDPHAEPHAPSDEPDPDDPAVWDALPHVVRGALRDRLTDPDGVSLRGAGYPSLHGRTVGHATTIPDALDAATVSGAGDPHPAAWGRRLLPVQSHPDTDAQRDGLPVPDTHLDVDATTDRDALVHRHRHAHHARPGDRLAVSSLAIQRYDHAHAHAHPGAVPDDRTYHDDHAH